MLDNKEQSFTVHVEGATISIDRDKTSSVSWISYFENECGQSVAATANPITGIVTVYHSDEGFKPKRLDRRFFQHRDIHKVLDYANERLTDQTDKETLEEVRQAVESGVTTQDDLFLIKSILQLLGETIGNLDDLMLSRAEQEWLHAFWDAFSPQLNLVPLTVGQAAKQYNIAEKTLYTAIKRGTLRAKKANGTMLIIRTDLENYLGSMHPRPNRQATIEKI